jgi:hypothetical protein
MQLNPRILAALAIALSVAMVLSTGTAATAAKTPKPPKAKTLSGTATITGTGGAIAPLVCTASGYADQCPSGTCSCFTITGAKEAGKLLGSASVDLAVTIDSGDALSTATLTCSPVYGQAIVTLTGKSAGVETINFQGAFCGAPVKGKALAGGAWQIFQSTNGESGLGTVTGQGVISTSGIDLTLSGSATITP